MNAIRRMYAIGLLDYVEAWAGGIDSPEEVEYNFVQNGMSPDVQKRVSVLCDQQLERDFDKPEWLDRDPVQELYELGVKA